MATIKFDDSLESGAHRTLQILIGYWQGTCKTWFEPDVLVDEAKIQATVTSLLGKRFISIDYDSTLEEKPFEGKMIVGFDLPYSRFIISWMDSFHMGSQIMMAEGGATQNGFSVLGSYGSPEYDSVWGWRTELSIVSNDEFFLTAYNITPEGEEAKATEAHYKRVSNEV
ncbi:DUF1579 domain-containing protein [Pedobacter sp. AW1-32]|uniref:DUF1579 domain-containing protein n=1 Tax=Pedobacter sp. AW1-32 TaxID=3383026 RepID=UPI003FEFEED3